MYNLYLICLNETLNCFFPPNFYKIVIVLYCFLEWGDRDRQTGGERGRGRKRKRGVKEGEQERGKGGGSMEKDTQIS